MKKQLKNLMAKVRARDLSTTPLPPKTAEPHYVTPEHRAWRNAVLTRAGARCEHVNGFGVRCERAYPHRLYADHIVELKDGGAPLDPANGMALCSSHHTIKTNAARAERWK